MKNKIIALFKNETVKYIIIGGCTTCVNFIIFAFLYNFIGLNLNIINFIAILLSIIFAFFANKIIVFSSPFSSYKGTAKELLLFILGRAFTMILELLGVWLAVDLLSFNEYISKLFMQIIVIIINYFISKFLVFKGLS